MQPSPTQSLRYSIFTARPTTSDREKDSERERDGDGDGEREKLLHSESFCLQPSAIEDVDTIQNLQLQQERDSFDIP